MYNLAIIVNAHTNSGLAITRSLGRRGIRVLAICDSRPSLSGLSRYCSDVIYVPSISAHAGEAARRLEGYLRTCEPGVVFATNDAALMFIHQFADIFERHVCAVPDPCVAKWALDKAQTVRLASRLGVAVPQTWLPEDYESPAILIEEVSYPCVIKPRQSRYWTADNRLLSSGSVLFCRGREELLDALSRGVPVNPIVQEFVKGEGRGVYLLMEQGEVRMSFAHRRLREGDPRGSGASLAESIPVDEALGTASLALLREAKWNGVAMVEFKVGEHPYLMEINGRFWNSLPLSLQSGCDFPWQLFRLFTQRPVEFQDGYRIGVKCRSLPGDIAHVAHALRGRPSGWSGTYPGRLTAVAGFLRAFWPDVRSYTFAYDDPLPGLMELPVTALSRSVS